MPETFSLSHRSSLLVATALFSACGGGGFLGIGGAATPKICFELQASKELNLFDGQAHIVVVHFYPVSNVTAFEATGVRDLIRGAKPEGLAGEPWRTTVLPGQKLKLTETVPAQATHIGVVADYYAGPSRVIVATTCDSGEEVVSLSPSEVVLSRPKADGKSNE